MSVWKRGSLYSPAHSSVPPSYIYTAPHMCIQHLALIHCTSYAYTTPISHLYTLHLALFCSCALYTHMCSAQPLWSQLIRYLSSDERHMHTPLDIRLVFHCSPIGCQLLLSPVSIVTLLCPLFLLYYAPCLECITPQVPIVSPFYAQHYSISFL